MSENVTLVDALCIKRLKVETQVTLNVDKKDILHCGAKVFTKFTVM